VDTILLDPNTVSTRSYTAIIRVYSKILVQSSKLLFHNLARISTTQLIITQFYLDSSLVDFGWE
jgi:hypothetical protein